MSLIIIFVFVLLLSSKCSTTMSEPMNINQPIIGLLFVKVKDIASVKYLKIVTR